MRARATSVLGLAVAATLVTAGMASAGSSTATFWVDDDGQAGPGGCDSATVASQTVQSAVDAAGPDDRITVCPGTYVEAISIGPGKRNLLVRAATPWTAVIETPGDIPAAHDSLIAIIGVRDVEIRHLRLRARTAGSCEEVDNMVYISDAPRTSVRGLRISAIGSDTLGDCGYADGIDMVDGASGFIGYNLIVNFKQNGIELGNLSSVVAYRNSIRFRHPSAGPVSLGAGIDVDSGASVRLLANVINGLETAGTSTPALAEGIDIDQANEGSSVRENSIWYTVDGMNLSADGLRVRDNELVGVGSGQGIQLEQSQGSRVLQNSVRGFNVGIRADADAQGHLLRGNSALGNALFDCRDLSSGGGTAGSANTWTNNVGDSSSPAGLCLPPA